MLLHFGAARAFTAPNHGKCVFLQRFDKVLDVLSAFASLPRALGLLWREAPRNHWGLPVATSWFWTVATHCALFPTLRFRGIKENH